jgi:hypothetical protein
MSQNYQLMSEKEDHLIYNNPKMKFLDDLFEDKIIRSHNAKSISLDTKKKEFVLKEEEYSNLETKRAPIISLKIFIGLLFSFFFLSYVFSFRLMIVVPLTLISLFLYLINLKGHKNYHQHVKSIRRGLHNLFKKIKRRNNETSEEEKHGIDYILLK